MSLITKYLKESYQKELGVALLKPCSQGSALALNQHTFTNSHLVCMMRFRQMSFLCRKFIHFLTDLLAFESLCGYSNSNGWDSLKFAAQLCHAT